MEVPLIHFERMLNHVYHSSFIKIAEEIVTEHKIEKMVTSTQWIYLVHGCWL